MLEWKKERRRRRVRRRRLRKAKRRKKASLANLRGLNNMSFFKKPLDKIWGIGIGFVVGFLVAGWASSAGVLTGF